MSAVTVRAPQVSEAQALGALHNLVWRHAYAGLMPDDYLASRDDAAAGERWKAAIAALDAEGREASGRRTLVAVPVPVAADETGEHTDRCPIGFITVGPARRAEHPGMTELMALYVHPAWHGRGVAQELTRVAFQDPAFAGSATMLWVLDGNARAIRFYEKLGFEPRDVFLTHEPTGTQEQLMVRSAESAQHPEA